MSSSAGAAATACRRCARAAAWPTQRPSSAWTDRGGGPGTSPGPHPALLLLETGQRFAGLEERLQAAEDVHPALARHALGGLGCVLELVVHHGEETHPAAALVDFPGYATRLFGRELRVVARDPRVDEPARRVRLEHIALHGEASVAAQVGAVRRARLEVRLHRRAVEVAPRELGFGDRVTDPLGRRSDEP